MLTEVAAATSRCFGFSCEGMPRLAKTPALAALQSAAWLGVLWVMVA